MKNKKFLTLVLLATSIFFWGCQTRAGTGGLIGGAAGAGVGGVIGGGPGALIGGAGGAIAGGVIGAILDENDQEYLRERNPQTYQKLIHEERLTISDVINLSQARVSDDKIIALIRKTNSSYNLNRDQIDYMRDEGVSERVISYMMYET